MTDGGEPPAGTGGRPPTARALLRLRSTAGNLEYDRVLFFSDAVFAIAITLLALDIRVPDLPASRIDSGEVLRAAGPRILGFAISFVVIGLFWIRSRSPCWRWTSGCPTYRPAASIRARYCARRVRGSWASPSASW